MSAISVMTTLPIATQRPLYDYIGQTGCHFYWGINIVFQSMMVYSGLGMAIYRLICFHYLFKKELNTKKIAHYILLSELGITVGVILLSVGIFEFFGWERHFSSNSA